MGWGATITEINNLAQDFEEIYHVAFLHSGEPPSSSLPYTAKNIRFIALQPMGGKTFGKKLNILTHIPNVIKAVKNVLKKVDVFQLRAPTAMGIFLIPYLSLFSDKKGWYKYAGNWVQPNPPLSYALQKWMLKKQSRKVTINGKWPDQPDNILSFENPCLTLEDRKNGQLAIDDKDFGTKYSYCFVGRMEDDKGVQIIIDAFKKLGDFNSIEAVYFVGDGKKLPQYKIECEAMGLPAKFFGFLERDAVFDLYKKCHFILLPSRSEGFPKVIGEAMNYGCIPIVSDVSCIAQYIDETNGYLLNPINSNILIEVLVGSLLCDTKILKNKSLTCYKDSTNFTFIHYLRKIKTEILDNDIPHLKR